MLPRFRFWLPAFPGLPSRDETRSAARQRDDDREGSSVIREDFYEAAACGDPHGDTLLLMDAFELSKHGFPVGANALRLRHPSDHDHKEQRRPYRGAQLEPPDLFEFVFQLVDFVVCLLLIL